MKTIKISIHENPGVILKCHFCYYMPSSWRKFFLIGVSIQKLSKFSLPIGWFGGGCKLFTSVFHFYSWWISLYRQCYRQMQQQAATAQAAAAAQVENIEPVFQTGFRTGYCSRSGYGFFRHKTGLQDFFLVKCSDLLETNGDFKSLLFSYF